MGCGTSTLGDTSDPLLEGKRKNDAIEKGMRQGHLAERFTAKLLLLGAGESGKSTVLKQMKLLHQGGFSHQERLQYAQVLWVDAIQAMKILIGQARKMRLPLDCDDPRHPLYLAKQVVLRSKALGQIDTGAAGGSDFLNDYVVRYSHRSETDRRITSTGEVKEAWGLEEPYSEYQEGVGAYPDISLEMEVINEGLNGLSGLQGGEQTTNASRKQLAEAIKQLWENDKGIQACYARSNEFQLEGSTAYYFERITAFADPLYLCTDEDILRGRIKTTGITETNFSIGNSRFKIIDTGGQRSERRKWIHCFEDITAVIFVLAISEYDQMLFEDERVNRMHESIALFDSVCNSRWFVNTPFILFLNKTDLFEQKLLTSPLRRYFPDYRGNPHDPIEAAKYFESLFTGLNRQKKAIYVHRTRATDTQTMRFVLTAVTDMVMQLNLRTSGII